jgi:cytochrome c553
VENSAIALAEAASLLSIAGRKCSNGVDVPVKNPDWAKFVTELREAGRVAYKAAQSKNQDQMVDAADTLSAACAGCHRKWREKPRLADRCK